ncbi:MAG: cytochrome P450 [Acidimicrobiales bacterium]
MTEPTTSEPMTPEPMTPDEVELDDFGLFDPAVQQCPHAYYARMQQEAPVFEAAAPGGSLHLVTRHADVLDVILDTETFSSRFDTGGLLPDSDYARRIRELYEKEGGYDRIGTMLTVDPPDHTRYRRLVSKAFTPRVISALEPTIREITAGLIDQLLAATADGQAVDFVEAFAVPLPVTVIAKALNVPDDRLADFKRWSDASIAGIGTNISLDERLEAEREVIEYQHYFAEQINLRRTEPQDDILTNLLNARIDRETDDIGDDEEVSEEPLTMPEMLSIIQQLLVAGNETTTKMLTEMMRLLGENPDEWQTLRAGTTTGDESEAEAAAKAVVEETLRLSTPTQGMFRVVTEDAEVAGAKIPAGSRVVAMFAAANRDPEVFDEPEEFQPGRQGALNHLAFGKGIHHCLGASLSRLEGRVAAEELSRRIESFMLTDGNDFAYHPSFMLRGLKRLEVTVDPA